MATIKATWPTGLSTLTIDLAMTATNIYSNLSSEIDNEDAANNGATTYLYADFELTFGNAIAAASVAGGYVGLYVIPLVGTTYPAAGQTGVNAIGPGEGFFAGVFPCGITGTNLTGLVTTCVNVPIPPLKFKVVCVNATGVTMVINGGTSTASVLKYRRHNLSVT